MTTEQRPRILLVEDDGSISQIIKIAINALYKSFDLDIAISAEEGLQLWHREPYDLLLTDYNLRGRNGLELITTLKADGATAPMVLFTAYDTPQLRNAARAANVTAFVAKPFFIDEFAELAHSLLPIEASQVGA